MFKKVFGENRAVLEDFLKSVLDLPADEYKDLQVIDSNLDRAFIEDKLGVLDVKVTTGAGKIIDIEVQIKPQRSIWKRMLFYTSKMIVEQVKSGYQYDQINRAISILIADFVMIRENGAYHNRFRLYDETTRARFPDSIEINVLELPKIQEADGTQLGNWMRFLSAKTKEDFMSIAQTNPAINEAWGLIKYLSGNERERALAEAVEKSRMDLDSYIADARYEGLQEGREEEKLEIARNLLQEKMPMEAVSRATRLSLEETKQLAAELSQ